MMLNSRRMDFTIRAFALMLMLATAGCASLFAGRGPSPEEIYAGMWEGGFDITMVAGGMRLVLNHDEGVWSGEVSLDVQGESVSAAVERFQITEEGCSFSMYIQEADVFFTGSVEDGVMTGSMTASAGGEMIDGVFSLTKK